MDSTKDLATSTRIETATLLNGDGTPVNGDAVFRSQDGVSANDMPSGLNKYGRSSDVIDTFSQDSYTYRPYDLSLADPKTYQQEVSSSSQLALRGIRSPYYELNLSDVLMGNTMQMHDAGMSRDGSSYVIQANDVTPPIINVTDIGQGGIGGISYM
jgi:hypothetical protein